MPNATTEGRVGGRGPTAGRGVQTQGTGPRAQSPWFRTPQTPGGGVRSTRSGRARPRGSLGSSGRPPRPAPALTQHSSLPQGAGALRAGLAQLGSRCSKGRRPPARARPHPAYRAGSPPRHRQRAPAASLSLRPLPASRALAGGHVTAGRRAGARAHASRTDLGLRFCCGCCPSGRLPSLYG